MKQHRESITHLLQILNFLYQLNHSIDKSNFCSNRFKSAPTLFVAVELIPHHKLEWVPDTRSPDGRRLEYTGYADNVVRYFAKAMNFS